MAILAMLLPVYFVAGKVGLSLAFFHASASPVWPPTGIALAAVLVFGYRVWPAIFLGAFLVNLTTQGTVATSLVIALGNAAEALIGGFLVNRFAGGRRVFDRPADIAKYALLVVPLATGVSATVGVSTLASANLAAWSDFWVVWLTWWTGDAAGALIVAPALVLWANDPHIRYDRHRAVEAALLAGALLTVGGIAFGAMLPTSFHDLPVSFLGIPLVAWAAFRFGQRESAVTTLVLSGLATYGTLQGAGPFVSESANESLLLLQAFMAIIASIALPLAAVERQKREVQDSLRAARDDLERRVRDRTADLEAAVRELQTFTYSVAHDLRGPLRAIDGHAEILLEEQSGTLAPEAADSLRRIKASTRHLGEVIEALLEFARLGRSELRSDQVNLSQTAQAAVEDLHHREPGRFVDVRIRPDLEVHGDPNLLPIVVQNLFQNAWKFTRSRPAAQIEFGAEDREGGRTFYVRDNGVGFDMGVANRLFVPFQRLHADRFEGIGIGLVTAERIVHRHGGRIWAESATDRGATFFFTLGE